MGLHYKLDKNVFSPAGNRTPVSRVTGGDTYHYTTEDTTQQVSLTVILSCYSCYGLPAYSYYYHWCIYFWLSFPFCFDSLSFFFQFRVYICVTFILFYIIFFYCRLLRLRNSSSVGSLKGTDVLFKVEIKIINKWLHQKPFVAPCSWLWPRNIMFIPTLFIGEQSGAVEACWAHNPEVRGSKPRSAKILFCWN